MLTGQNRRYRLGVHLLHPPRNVPRLARRSRRQRFRARSQTLPFPARLPSRASPHLHLFSLRPCLRTMAAHRLRRGQYDRQGHGQRQREERCRDLGYGAWLVWVWAPRCRYDWSARYDPEYQAYKAVDG